MYCLGIETVDLAHHNITKVVVLELVPEILQLLNFDLEGRRAEHQDHNCKNYGLHHVGIKIV